MDDALALLRRLLRRPPAPLPIGDDVAAWWRRFRDAEPGPLSPFDRAVLAGFRADRVAGAFAGGYQGALRALVRDGLPDDAIVSFCVSEPGGNSPKAIETTLAGSVINGQKKWSTMAPLADLLLVAAHEGVDAAGRKRFKLVRVPATAPGVTIRRLPFTKFIPEIPHAELELRDVRVTADAALPGDGYNDYVKRFRTVEDIYIHGGVLGYALGAARRFDFPPMVAERLAAAIVTMRTLARGDFDAPETHVALAGALARDATLLEHSDAHWEKADEGERARWRRDRAGFGSVAGALREARRTRAWERLADLR
ncbi:MAG TPA: acyl-CoA dehydrogenase family protein [Terriglobales bacterium]|nr:acyl-CoA dehydrogenase family protein [Terriglobales bacterium]